ncbi:RodZ domain-containing protein [Pseudoalteromonas luteoviolacea]|uniref:RodZ domain-containing protein n=1 Tax=Pseudoalteromonas luteoviolacea TaxID=43657 RepID=UPI001B35D8EB|nr:RodZ domain-containing protein [Pseudoalteromonas luteoviolacea]MBQ4837430.1 DUF4115 domain-containing protein [Pseudoalteromonas luteoviolacea]
MNQEENETTTESLSLGQTLAHARAEQNLSFDDIAARLKLNHSQITKLENDEYQSLGPETFVRGYVKSYSALLGLDSEQVLALYETPEVPEQKRNMKSFSRRTEKEANDNRLMVVSYLVLIVFVGLSAFWWWQTASTSEGPEEISGLNEAITTPETTSSSLVTSGEASQAIESNIATADVSEQAASAEPLEQPREQSILAQDVAVASDELAVEPATNDVSEAAETIPAASAQQSEPVAEQPEPEIFTEVVESSTVVMYFEQDSWVEIFDATQERVAFGVKKAGYTMTVTGLAPFSVVLGKHQVVSIELDGQPIDISGLPRNRLAKFKLPLAE